VNNILQVLTFPFFAALFFMDRVVLLFVWSETGHKFKRWLYHEALMVSSVIRVFMFLCIVLFISIFLFSAS